MKGTYSILSNTFLNPLTDKCAISFPPSHTTQKTSPHISPSKNTFLALHSYIHFHTPTPSIHESMYLPCTYRSIYCIYLLAPFEFQREASSSIQSLCPQQSCFSDANIAKPTSDKSMTVLCMNKSLFWKIFTLSRMVCLFLCTVAKYHLKACTLVL